MGRAHEVRAASMAKTAAAKSKLNAKWGRAIYVAAKSGVPDPEMNQALKKEIEKAKREQVTADVIKRAIDKAKGGQGESYESERFEAMGPGNSMWIIETLTDNHNRTLTSIRTAFSKTGGQIASAGSASYMFKNQAVFTFAGDSDEETLEILLGADCEPEDVVVEDGEVTVYAAPSEYTKIREALLAAKPDLELLEDKVAYIPQSYVKLKDEHDKAKYDRLMEILDEDDDVQNVYNNIDFDDEE